MSQFIKDSLPFWGNLTKDEQREILEKTKTFIHKQGTVLYYGGGECSGLELIQEGQIRVFITSEKGGQITLYRLLPGDICILSAACMIKSLDIEVHMEMEKDTTILIIPKDVYENISNQNNAVKGFSLEILSDRFSNIMWVMNQIVFSNMGSRLANTLIEHSVLVGSNTLPMTHENLAKDLGTAREVVSRLLKQFEMDGYVVLARGEIQITNMEKLRNI